MVEVNKIYQGDVIEELKKIPDGSINLIFTDPPFNLGKNYGSDDSLAIDDYYEWCFNWLHELVRVLSPTGNLYIMNLPKHCAVFYNYLKDELTFKNWITWIRNDNQFYAKQKGFKPNHQDIIRFVKTDKFYFNWRGAERTPIWNKDKRVKGMAGEFDTWNITYVKGNSKEKTNHPCPMPIALADRIIKTSSKEEDVVLDCFMGSGTTAISCLRNNRKFIGIELSKDYCKVANERIQRELSQDKLNSTELAIPPKTLGLGILANFI
jgi:site-specific DNA-methyltransferase (adenine-specific)